MAGKQAKILSTDQFKELLFFVETTRYARRNRVLVLLSVKAGLRASEIAKLTWDMALNPTGQVGTVIELRDHAAKKRHGRSIPIHGDLREALAALLQQPTAEGPVIRSERGAHMTGLSIVVWFRRAYDALGFCRRRRRAQLR